MWLVGAGSLVGDAMRCSFSWNIRYSSNSRTKEEWCTTTIVGDAVELATDDS